MTNLTMLQRNTLHGMTEEAGALYMRGVERDEAKAFRAACEWQDKLEPLLSSMVNAAVRGQPLASGRTAREVLEFIRERHFRRYFPDGRA